MPSTSCMFVLNSKKAKEKEQYIKQQILQGLLGVITVALAASVYISKMR